MARQDPCRPCGAVLVEFAVVVPLLLLIVLGILEYGQYVQAHEAVSLAAREAARVAVAPGGSRAEATERARQVLAAIGIEDFQIRFQPDPPETALVGQAVEVTIEAEFREISWLPLPMRLEEAPLRATSVMRVEFENFP
jgi:hypothetical protein